MEPDTKTFPFTTRNDLTFEHGTSFDLEVRWIDVTGIPFNVVGMTKNGIFKFNVNQVDASGSLGTSLFKLPDIPVFLTASQTDADVDLGEQWTEIYLRANGERILRLGSGYITAMSGFSWPEVQSIAELDRRGRFLSTSGSNPAANTEASISVSTDKIWRLRAARVQLVTDANAANRRVHLSITHASGGLAYDVISSIDIPANTTRVIHFMPYPTIPDAEDDNDIVVSIPPDIILLSGGSIATSTTNRQVGDDFGALNVQVEEWMAI